MLTWILASCESFLGLRRLLFTTLLFTNDGAEWDSDTDLCVWFPCARGARDPHLQSTAPASPRSWTPPSRTWPGSTAPAGACGRVGPDVKITVSYREVRAFHIELTFPVEITGSCQSYHRGVAAVSQWPPKTTHCSLVDKHITNACVVKMLTKLWSN